MNYCTKGQWVAILTTGQVGTVNEIIKRRDHNRDGKVVVQCGAGGPFVKADMGVLRELSRKEYEIATGIRYHEN